MFYIIEIQEQIDGTGAVVTPIKTATDQNNAMSKYHSTLASAAISPVYKHTVAVLDGSGQYLARETYTHRPDPEGDTSEVTA